MVEVPWLIEWRMGYKEELPSSKVYKKLFLVCIGDTLLGLVFGFFHIPLEAHPVDSESGFNWADPEGAVGETSSEPAIYQLDSSTVNSSYLYDDRTSGVCCVAVRVHRPTHAPNTLLPRRVAK